MACGTFTTYNGTARGGVAKVSATGVLDTSFGPTTATTAHNPPNIIYDVLALTNGQLLAGGPGNQVDATYNPVSEFSGSFSDATRSITATSSYATCTRRQSTARYWETPARCTASTAAEAT